jgi:hypothetical protein
MIKAYTVKRSKKNGDTHQKYELDAHTVPARA